jgi:DNA-binding NarL/FixJ family response regulator
MRSGATSGFLLDALSLGIMEKIKNGGVQAFQIPRPSEESISLAADGLSDKEIAELEGIKVKTVQNRYDEVHDRHGIRRRNLLASAYVMTRKTVSGTQTMSWPWLYGTA